MKIRRIRFHESVLIAGEAVTFLPLPRDLPIEISISKDQTFAILTDTKESREVHIPMTNVVFFEPVTPIIKKKPNEPKKSPSRKSARSKKDA